MRPAKCPVYLLLLLCRRRNTVWLQLILISLFASSAAADTPWKFGASIGAGATLTDNVFLAPSGQQQSDLVLNVTPTLTASLDAARLKVQASFAPTLYTYVQNPGSDYVANNLSAFASLEAAEKFFWVDAFARVSETYISPFASQPQNGASITQNRTTTTVLGLSPYIKSTTSSGVSYLVRSDSTYSSSNTSGLANSYGQNLLATADGPTGRPLRWGADYNYNYTSFQGQPSAFTLQLARFRLTYVVDPELSVTGDVGYEKNDYTLSGYEGAIYGAGFDWKPSPITNLYANLEHRFFGTAYTAGFNHRTRWTALTLNGSYGLQTYPQQFLVPAGNTRQVVDAIFQARIPDPIERQKAVNSFLQQTGLPPSLASPFTYYTNQIYTVNSVTATYAVIGTRNVLTFSAFWYKSTPITASGQALPSVFTSANEVRQSGGGISFSHQISAMTSAVISGNRVVTYSNSTNAASYSSITSTQDTVVLTLSQQFSAKTSGSVGLRFVRFNSDIASSYTEHAILAGVLHTF